MDSDSDENSRSQSDLSRFSMNSSNASNHRSNLSDQISKLAQSLDESVILTKRRKNVKKRILESDSESENQNESGSESDKSDQKDSGSDDNDQNESGSVESDVDNQNDSRSVESESDDQSESDAAELEADDDTKDDQQFAYQVESDVTEDDEADEDKSDSSLQQSTTHDSSVVIPETDDDEDLEEAEKEASMLVYSPRTRRTITGRRSTFHKPVESDEDEIFSEEKSVSHSDYKSAEASKELESSTDFDNNHSENIKRNRSIAPVLDISAIYTPKAKRFSMNRANSGSISPKTSTPSRSSTPDIDFSDKSSASEAHSYHIQSDQSESKSKLSSSSVVILNSDDSDEENRKPNHTIDFKGVNASTPGPSSKLIQPKLNFDRKPNKLIKTFVSRAYYNKKVDELAMTRKECKDNEDLFKTIGSTLPDKGRNLKVRVESLQRELRKKEIELETYAIEEDHLDDVMIVEQPTNNKQSNNVGRDWRSELETIQPQWTGEKGLSTFNTQKQLTLNRIEKLHKAMEKCPTENDFARQPDYLNVQLMPHQLNAIKWMRWREVQKPKGGILADDMGLGKTLTVIGLVLDDKYGKELSQVEEDEEDDDEDGGKDESDDENQRGYKKTYKNEGGSLIVCPASLINQWEKEIENRVKRRKLSVLMHHGNKRKDSAHSICKYDLVITTYGVISSEHKNNSALFRIRWKRVVLDEAHMIRNHTTAVAKGCCDLRSAIRWGLTGTPIQNKHMDVYSMFKFLRVTPFDDLATYKKWIDPKTQAGMSRLHNILKPLLLRRTKAELQLKGELQALPTKEILIEDIELTPAEANIYTKILAYSQTLFAQYMEQHQQRMGEGGKVQLPSDIQKRLEQVRRFGQGQDVKSSQILVLLLRLRQICDHPGLINQMLMDECDLENCDEEDFGSIEMNMVKQMIGLKISDHDEQANASDEEEAKGARVLLNTNQIFDFKHPSTKCKRTIEIVKRILNGTNDKIVIVSQWTTFLNVVSDFLNRERVHYVELTGKTPIKDRNDIIVSFNKPNTPERVLMLSLVAGGVGLNLTGANHLILLDPHWNPQLESQAFDRVYRVGQTKDVKIYKLLCVKTIEKHIQNIQDRKLELSDNVLTGSKISSSKLSIQDMRQLFDM